MLAIYHHVERVCMYSQRVRASNLILSGSFLPLTRDLATRASGLSLVCLSILRPIALSSFKKICLACLALYACT